MSDSLSINFLKVHFIWSRTEKLQYEQGRKQNRVSFLKQHLGFFNEVKSYETYSSSRNNWIQLVHLMMKAIHRLAFFIRQSLVIVRFLCVICQDLVDDLHELFDLLLLFCQAQPPLNSSQLQRQLRLRLALFPADLATHPPGLQFLNSTQLNST